MEARGNAGKFRILNRDAMKSLAILTMLIGHMVAWINLLCHPSDQLALYSMPAWLISLCGLAVFCPPVMFFFITEGYKHTRNLKKYAMRLLIFACLTQPFDWLIFQPICGWRSTNVLFTLFLGLLSIIAWESKLKLWQRIACIALCITASVLIFSEWFIFGILFILALHIFREQPKKRFLAYTILALAYCATNLYPFGKVPAFKLAASISAMLAALMAAYCCMTALYNGGKGKHHVFAQWFFYIFYPLHYLIIWLAKMGIDHFQLACAPGL
ncbi:MAG: conjugal transfer protein TraX [bacterium]|nr:conjugal transfer protein TraX [bacterium]